MDELRSLVMEAIEDDWVYFAEFLSMIQELDQSSHDLLRKAGDAAAHMVQEGVIIPGTLTEAEGFTPWPSNPAESAARIEREVAAMIRDGVEPNIGDLCWFDLPQRSQSNT